MKQIEIISNTIDKYRLSSVTITFPKEQKLEIIEIKRELSKRKEFEYSIERKGDLIYITLLKN